MEYLEIISLSTDSHDFVLSEIKLESLSASVVVTIQPPPLCGPTNINSSIIVCLERTGNIVYNISIQQRSCLEEMTTTFIVDCPLMLIPVMKLIVYTNGTITALSNDNGIITCVDGVWPNTNTIGKNDKN